MKKWLSVCVLGMFLQIPFQARSSNGVPPPSRVIDEEALYIERNETSPTPLTLRLSRSKDVMTYMLEERELVIITQSPDGRVTTFNIPKSPVVRKMIFSEPVFELPHLAISPGKMFDEHKETKAQSNTQDVYIGVKRTATTVTYSYLRFFSDGKEVETVTYSNNSRLFDTMEQVVVVGDKITKRMTLTRIHE